MNTRERFLASMDFEPLDRPLLWEFGYWAPILKRWYAEGLARGDGAAFDLPDDAVVSGECLGIDWRNPVYGSDVNAALGFDEFMHRIPINNLYSPPWKEVVLEDYLDRRRVRDSDGAIVEISKMNGSKHFVDAPVKTRADYEAIREERLQPNLADRLPNDWPELHEQLRNRSFPLEYGGMQGFFNTPRRLMGFERLMSAFYDEPELVKEIINDTADLLINLYDPVLSDIGGDCGLISEDMCYKGGCFISPAMFQEFMMPAYKKLTGFFRDHGIKTILVDSDGDVTGLIPLLIESGVTGLYPFECTGNNDIVKIRKAFPRFQILGGIDKKKIALGKYAIDQELEYKLSPLHRSGGFVPFIDHTVPPDISWSDFCYYRHRIVELAAK